MDAPGQVGKAALRVPEAQATSQADEDRRKSLRLLRYVSMLIMWPAFSTGVVLMFAGGDHILHTSLFMGIGLMGLGLLLAAPKLAK